MKILNINANTVSYNTKYRNTNINAGISQSDVSNRFPIEHAGTLAALNNISFQGLFSSKNDKPTMENILNAAIQNLNDKSIVLFCDSLERAKLLLNAQLKDINFPLENIYFVKNEKNNTSFAVYKDITGDFKLFKLHPLDGIDLLTGGTDKWKDGVKYQYAKTADEPIELHNGQYLKFGFKEEETVLRLDIFNTGLINIFDKYVQKDNYLENAEKIRNFNTLRLKNSSSAGKNATLKNIKFDDIGGQDDNIKTLEENIIFPLKYPDFYKNFRINKGILLYGPPRCGKTMLALALANELDINFIKLSADDLTHANVGKTEENWRNIFKEAREKQPTIIFIDEFDAVAKQRSGADSARYQDNVVNQLLALMSDLEKSDDKVFVLAATNRKDMLDKALTNTGRFGLQIEVKEPDLEGTKQIFEKHAKNKPIDENIDKDFLCKKMYENHFNGSDIAEIFYIAHRHAMEVNGIYEKMRNNTATYNDVRTFKLSHQDLDSAIDKLANQKNEN